MKQYNEILMSNLIRIYGKMTIFSKRLLIKKYGIVYIFLFISLNTFSVYLLKYRIAYFCIIVVIVPIGMHCFNENIEIEI